MRSTTTQRLLSMLLLTIAPLALSACGDDLNDAELSDLEGAGSFRLALTTVGTSGKTYRLRRGIFDITGPDGYYERIDTGSQSGQSDPDDANSLTITDLAPGFYSIYLLDGWGLSVIEDGQEQDVDAGLLTEVPASVEILHSQTASQTFRFSVQGEEVVFGGDLEIDIGVDETATMSLPNNAYCAPFETWSAADQAFELELIELINERRVNGIGCHGSTAPTVEAFRIDPAAYCAVRAHVSDMYERDYRGDVDPDGVGGYQRLQLAGATSIRDIGGASGAGLTTPEAYVDALFNSELCRTALEPNLTHIGVAYLNPEDSAPYLSFLTVEY